MKALRSAENCWEIQLGHWEMSQFLELLSLYPCVPPAHHVISSDPGEKERVASSQVLLDEALEEHRRELRESIEAFLTDPGRCQANTKGGKLKLSAMDLEWVLQVLNDIRVGSWIRAGSPESGTPVVTGENARDIWAMEVSGYFQMSLLEAVSRKP